MIRFRTAQTWHRLGAAAAGLCLLLLPALCAWAGRWDEGDPYRQTRMEITENALDFLAGAANADGSFGDSHRRLQTGLAILAFLSAGERPGEGPRGEALTRAYRSLLEAQAATGFVGDNELPMEGHGIASLAFAELTGLGVSEEDNQRLYKAAVAALDYTLSSQDKSYGGRYGGGWKDEPRAKINDRKVSGWQLAFMQEMGRSGREVSKSALLRGMSFLKGSFKPKDEQQNRYDVGGFSYDAEGLPVESVSAAGFYCMEESGDPASERTLTSDWFTNNPPVWKGPHFYYTQFFAVRALRLHAWSAGTPEAWERCQDYYREVTETLHQQQRPDGSFGVPPGNAEYTKTMGATYATPMAVLILNADRNLLPMDRIVEVARPPLIGGSGSEDSGEGNDEPSNEE